MNILSFLLGIATGIIFVMSIALAMGMHLRRHPEIMVRQITQRAIRGMRESAASNSK